MALLKVGKAVDYSNDVFAICVTFFYMNFKNHVSKIKKVKNMNKVKNTKKVFIHLIIWKKGQMIHSKFMLKIWSKI